MKVRTLALLGCLSVLLIADAQTLQGYTIRLYPPDWQTALVVVPVPATAVVCGQPKMAGTAAPVNPTKLLFDDPADATKDCVYLDTTGVLRQTSPFWPDAGPWQVSMSARFDSGEKPESNRVTFTRTPVVAPPPLPPTPSPPPPPPMPPPAQQWACTVTSVTGASPLLVTLSCTPPVVTPPPPPPPPPAPVDCVVSAWSAWTPVGACTNSLQSETRTRTIVTPAANGGAACGPLTESRSVGCTVTPPPPPPPPTGGAHSYFDSLVARADHWKSYSLRDPAQLLAMRASASQAPSIQYVYPNDPDPRKQDGAKVTVPTTTNSIPNQVFIPLSTLTTSAYLFTWDAWYGIEFRTGISGLVNHKTFRIDGIRAVGASTSAWVEVQTQYQPSSRLNGPGITSGDIAKVGIRQYSAVGFIPPVTNFDPVQPNMNYHIVAPERWTRYWVLVEAQEVISGKTARRVTVWVADTVTGPTMLLDRIPFPMYGSINIFRLEYNTSTDAVKPGRPALVSYVRNWAVLRDVANVAPLLVKPLVQP